MENESNIEELRKKIGFGKKVWLKFENESILGSGWANLLKIIEKNEASNGSLTQAAKECGYSYKYAWNILKRIGNRTGAVPADAFKGGIGGGGWIKLNEWGKWLLRNYFKLEEEIDKKVKKLEKLLDIQE